uniref:uncharacterized protein LOC114587471 isoform X2 n=1 Tax=Podarcis muralis TaxID=64176 RepID=UPI0010A07E0A|nr:uncharacterized protein LOC114587471 isoform X2 [Podarcis muralis]
MQLVSIQTAATPKAKNGLSYCEGEKQTHRREAFGKGLHFPAAALGLTHALAGLEALSRWPPKASPCPDSHSSVPEPCTTSGAAGMSSSAAAEPESKALPIVVRTYFSEVVEDDGNFIQAVCSLCRHKRKTIRGQHKAPSNFTKHVQIIRSFGLGCHQYADDTQLYLLMDGHTDLALNTLTLWKLWLDGFMGAD